jgi:hypothetical protein
LEPRLLVVVVMLLRVTCEWNVRHGVGSEVDIERRHHPGHFGGIVLCLTEPPF